MKKTKLERLSEQGISKKLIVSDIRIPFDSGVLLAIVERHKDEIDEIIFNGDTVDCFEISCWPSIYKSPLVEEMEATHRLLSDIESMTPNIKKTLVKGNHESRWERYLANHSTSLTPLHSSNILTEIVGGFTNHDYDRSFYITYNPLPNYNVVDTWFYQVNDMICCHPLSFSKVKAKTATMAVDYFIQQGFDFNAIAIAHTHKQSFVRHYGKLAYEQGCLCQPMAYSQNGKLNYTPQDCGYMLATFKDSKFQPNQSRLYVL